MQELSIQDIKSPLISRHVRIEGKRTSIRLDKYMWQALKEVANIEGCGVHDICTVVSMRKQPGVSLSSAIRVFLLMYYKAAATEEGHDNAGHGNFTQMLKRAGIDEEVMRIFEFNGANKKTG